MRARHRLLVPILVSLLVAPAPAFAWGSNAHRYIMGRAIDLLPPQIKPFFDHFRNEIVIRAIDPDLWRNVGWEEDPNHFMDFGVEEYGAYPFAALPREYGAAIEKFGMATLKRNGLLPWREAEEFGNLRRAMEGFARKSAFAPTDVVLFTGVAAHYIQDAHQPLHATNNYDGAMTKQNGVHSRFETALFNRFQSRLTLTPAPPRDIPNIRDYAFDVLVASNQLVGAVLDADRQAVAGKDVYDDDYFEKFLAKVKPVLERRIGESISATASMIVSAWERAGRPTLMIDVPSNVQKVREPSGPQPPQPPIVQPGAPGQPSQIISAEKASDISRVEYTGADIKFMQGMIGHHEQAVEMVALIAARTRREDMRLLGRRIDLSQTDEIGMMRRWLEVRRQKVPEKNAMHMHGATLMPGMLTPDEMTQLASAQGDRFDRLFLEGMIKHHEGALAMVNDLLSTPGAGQDPEIFSFAADVDTDQRMEIERMSAMLGAISKERQR